MVTNPSNMLGPAEPPPPRWDEGDARPKSCPLSCLEKLNGVLEDVGDMRELGEKSRFPEELPRSGAGSRLP